MKSTITLIISIFLIFTSNYISVAAAENAPIPTADSAILIDAETGKILYSKNMDTAYPPASTTKVMTALLTLEKTQMDDLVTVGKKPPFAEGSSIGIREGEVFKVKELLYGLLLESGNDCAEALAEHIGGTKEKFAEMMNARAKELGAENTNFVNPSGLYNKDHKTSAHDLALMMRELVKHPEYSQIATTLSHKIDPTNKCDVPRYTNNKNKLVMKGNSLYYKDTIGGKTGYTIESQHSYVAAAERNGQRLIVALIHDSKNDCFEDAIALFNYGFNNFELKRLFSKGDEVTSYKVSEDLSIPLLAGEDFYYVKEKNSNTLPTYKISENDLKNKSFLRGDNISEATILYNGTQLGVIDLASGMDHQIKPIVSAIEKTKDALPKSNNIFTYTIGSIVFIFAGLLVIRRRNIRKRRLQRSKYYSSKYNNGANL